MGSKAGPDRWFSESEAAVLLAPIIDAVASLHERGIVHRDLRLAKIAIRISNKDRVFIQVHGFEHAVCLKLKEGQTSVKQGHLGSGNYAPEI